MPSVKRRLTVKFRREMSDFERPPKMSTNKNVGGRYDVPCCKVKFYWDYKCINYFAELASFHKLETIC